MAAIVIGNDCEVKQEPVKPNSKFGLHPLNSCPKLKKFVKEYTTVKYSSQKADCGGMIVARRLGNGHVDVRICYDREFLRSCADSPYAILPPANIYQIVFEMSEILVSFPRRYHSPTSTYSLNCTPFSFQKFSLPH